MSRLSLRARLMVVGVSGVAVALLLGGVVLYGTLAVAVLRTLDAGARATAAEIVTLAGQDRLPDPLPVSGAQLVQVVDDQQRVIASSANADRLTPLLRPAELTRALGGAALTVDGARAGLTGPLRVVAARTRTPDGPRSVLVAIPIADVTHSQQALRTGLLIIFPLLLVVLAAIAWRVIGWTLRPVEALRAGADRISGSGEGERLPVPESADEIRALALTLNSMLDRLAAGRRRQRDFVADAAHELRNPLASIQLQLEVAERLGDGGSLPTELLADVHRLSRLVDDLLLLAGADADTRPPGSAESFDLTDLLTEVVSRYSTARVPVRLQPGAPVQLLAAREEIRRAIANVVDNAVRHAGHGVLLTVETPSDAEPATALIAVTDDGPGIAPADRERVFERFTRLDEARDRDAGGTGLGLAIVRELVRRAGGTVTLQDAAPGLRVEISLPRRVPVGYRGDSVSAIS
ncbi:HAMP domain-containing sensor histidine kinase [Microlunatus panaciterrae]|uniref:histidine kinase n=1 Tax=Microlunatus panaciterrae TaxID=400768 RepID=A0ABS2RIM9_9ACTN|nr:ATP-binding protein [Microlunatus panaciterrae]MBM7798846.1 signal transduction histidine kinase [Microlunatus panaciterrae]